MRNGGLTHEGSTTFGLHAGGDITLTKNRGEICVGDIINLLNASSAKVDAIEGAGVAGSDGRSDLNEPVNGHGTGGGLNVGKGLGDAKLVVLRGTVNPS